MLVALLTMFSVTVRSSMNAQTQPAPPIYGGNPQSQESGSATGGVFAPVLDSEKRPITAGGFVKNRANHLSGCLQKIRLDRLAPQDG